jgi:hypothetical protein
MTDGYIFHRFGDWKHRESKPMCLPNIIVYLPNVRRVCPITEGECERSYKSGYCSWIPEKSIIFDM